MITTDKVYENLEWTYGYREVDRLGVMIRIAQVRLVLKSPYLAGETASVEKAFIKIPIFE